MSSTFVKETNFLEYTNIHKNLQAPKLREFVDYRDFLRAWYTFKKEENPLFSYAVWASKAGFKSRSFLRLVILGKRTLGVDSIPLVIKSLNLCGTETLYFTNLVHFAHSNTIESRDYYFNEIVKLSKGTTNIVKDTYRFLSHLKTARVHLLINLKNLVGSIESISSLLEISHTETKDTLENLELLGLAVLDNVHNTWHGTKKELKIPSELGNMALQSFHTHSLKEAQMAIQLDPSTRHYGSVLMFLDNQTYADMKMELERFSDYLARKYHTASDNLTSKIYQINLNLIPASKEIFRTQTNTTRETKDSILLAAEKQEIEL